MQGYRNCFQELGLDLARSKEYLLIKDPLVFQMISELWRVSGRTLKHKEQLAAAIFEKMAGSVLEFDAA